MASQQRAESRLSRIVNGASPWISALVPLIYAILSITATTLYAFKLTLPSHYHLIAGILWGVGNTLGGLLLAMTIYGWAQFFPRHRQDGSSAASKVVSGERGARSSPTRRVISAPRPPNRARSTASSRARKPLLAAFTTQPEAQRKARCGTADHWIAKSRAPTVSTAHALASRRLSHARSWWWRAAPS